MANGLDLLAKKEREMNKKSWKTTAVGVVTGVVILGKQVLNLLNGEPVSLEMIAAGCTALGLGVFARDNNKSSEDVGAK